MFGPIKLNVFFEVRLARKSFPLRYNGAFWAAAVVRITSIALFCLTPVTTGIAGFMIPAFSVAICLMEEPRYSLCSRDTLVIIDNFGRMILVASSLPPIPVSIIAH